ncbi:MAG: [FeFe] hydrogenase H-cluster radical SAM maturase HydE [bacterium]|jgi:biotin synthase
MINRPEAAYIAGSDLCSLCNVDQISREEIIGLLQSTRQEETVLQAAADKARRENVGDEVHLRGLIEFSSYCHNDCLYCGLRRSNTKARRYRLDPDEIVAVAAEGVRLGYRTMVLQSGEDLWYSTRILAQMVERIKKLDVAVTLSIGERSYLEYRDLFLAGADRFLLRFETSDPDLYQNLHPGQSLTDRLHCLENLARIGYQVGSGHIVGLPGQTLSTLASDLLLLKELQLDMVGIGPFIPDPDTPLAHVPPGDVDLTLRTVAICRLFLPWAHIPATTALGTLDPAGRQKGLQWGSNVVMPNITPLEYRLSYQIYPRCSNQSEAAGELAKAQELLQCMGRPISSSYGHSLKPGR